MGRQLQGTDNFKGGGGRSEIKGDCHDAIKHFLLPTTYGIRELRSYKSFLPITDATQIKFFSSVSDIADVSDVFCIIN